MPRTITIPSPIIALNPITNKPIPKVEFDPEGKVRSEVPDDPWTIVRLLITCVFVRPEWEKGLARERMKHRLIDTFEGANGSAQISDEEWRALRGSLEADDFQLPKHFGYQLVALADAIIDAAPSA